MTTDMSTTPHPRTPRRSKTATKGNTPLLRQSSHRKAKSAANDKIAGQSMMESLNDNECIYNTNPDAFENDGRESEGRRALFSSSSENIMKVSSPLGDAFKPIPTLATPNSASCIVPSRAEAEQQGKENNSPAPVGNFDDETGVSLGEALRFNLDLENCPPLDLVGIRDGLLTPSTVKPTFASPTSARRILSSRAEQGKQNHSTPAGKIGNETIVSTPAGKIGDETVVSTPAEKIGDETVVSPSQEPKAAVDLLGVHAGLLTPPNESREFYKRQMEQVVRQLTREFVKRDILRNERAFWMVEMARVVRQLTREFVKRDILRNERAFWKVEMARVLEKVDVEFFGPDWDDWDLTNEQAFWKGQMARVLEQVDVEYFGPYWDDWDDL
jgi:hypothetical protein